MDYFQHYQTYLVYKHTNNESMVYLWVYPRCPVMVYMLQSPFDLDIRWWRLKDNTTAFFVILPLNKVLNCSPEEAALAGVITLTVNETLHTLSPYRSCAALPPSAPPAPLTLVTNSCTRAAAEAEHCLWVWRWELPWWRPGHCPSCRTSCRKWGRRDVRRSASRWRCPSRWSQRIQILCKRKNKYRRKRGNGEYISWQEDNLRTGKAVVSWHCVKHWHANRSTQRECFPQAYPTVPPAVCHYPQTPLSPLPCRTYSPPAPPVHYPTSTFLSVSTCT